MRLAEEIVIVGEHAPDELECECLVEAVQCKNWGSSPLPRSPSVAVQPVLLKGFELAETAA
jgi:hypothetical protein